MKAIFDVDGVLADFEGALVNYLSDSYDMDLSRHRRELYSLEDRYADILPFEDVKRFANTPSSYIHLESLHGVKFVNDLIDRGWDVWFLSSRPMIARGATERWLNNRIPRYYETRGVLVGVSDKHVAAKEWGADILVDDSPETVNQALNAGVNAFAWDQPWNQGVFPRLTCDRGGQVYIWETESTEEVPFFSVYEEKMA